MKDTYIGAFIIYGDVSGYFIYDTDDEQITF